MGRRKIDITGNRYGKLVALKEIDHRYWECLCDCGKLTITQKGSLISGKTTSCGCNRVKHSMYGTPTYVSWNSMLTRCREVSGDNWEKYGRKGVVVCDRWEPLRGGSFENFFEDMGERPEGTTLNRIGCSKIYSKETCEWADYTMQSFDKGRSKRCESGVIGVRWRQDRGVWEAHIARDGVSERLYYGKDFFEAICRRASAELRLYERSVL